jgi:hypothetical protein
MVTMTSSGNVVLKAGKNVSADLVSGTATGGTSAEDAINAFIEEAESYVNVATRFNWTDVYLNLNDDTKKILDQTVSDLAAMYAINYDMTGYRSTREAQTRLDVLRDRVDQSIKLLKDTKKEIFTRGA